MEETEQKTSVTRGKTTAKERALQVNCRLEEAWSSEQGNILEFEIVVKETGLGASLLRNKL